jgi:hypothetical protein
MSVHPKQIGQSDADTLARGIVAEGGALAREVSPEAEAERLPTRAQSPAPATEGNTGTKTREMCVRIVSDLEELSRHVGDWEDLAANAIEPNAFYEPWMLLPAARAFGDGKQLLFALVYAPHPRVESAPPVLYGLFPLERRNRYKGIPVKTLGLWQHLHCFLCTPLVRTERARECVAAFFDWLGRSGAALMEFNFVAGDGPFHQLLVEEFRERGTFVHADEYFTRALYRPAADAETYLRDSFSGKKRKELRRQEKRLAERGGAVEYVEIETDGDVDLWAEEFLRVEAEGWKGRGGTAMAASETERSYFMGLAREAQRRGRLMLLGLRTGGRFIALKCNFHAGAGSFAFKIAFDESLAQYSPGVLLEIENIRRLHERPEIKWMDSCSAPVNFINSLWPDRRTICTLVAATGKSPGSLIVSLLPLLRWLKCRLSFSRASAPLSKSTRNAGDTNAS